MNAYLKGSQGDAINLLMAACAWNLRKWMIAFFLFEVKGMLWGYYIACAEPNHPYRMLWLRVK
ncbi:MAG TPA: hypothetical protein ENJ08_11650 [Gammaproteobacteria bacterium]|nr:hypothetical protein [Gammaproteobacteria bacterium]